MSESWEAKKHKVFAGSVHMNSSRQHRRFKLWHQGLRVSSGAELFIGITEKWWDNSHDWRIDECLEAVSKRQAGQNWSSLALCYGELLMHRSELWQLWQAYRMPLGQDQTSYLQGRSFSRQLLLTSKPRQ